MTANASADERAGAFLDATSEAFARIARGGGVVAHDYLVADLRLRINVAKGPSERAICRALSHLEIPVAELPDLTISAWDSDSSGAPPVKPAWTTADYGRHGVIEGFNNARYHTAVQFEPIILRMLDRDARRAIYWTPTARALPHWELGAPLRPLLHEWLRGVGRLPVHGGAIGYPHGGVLLAGVGGSGKSNLALSSLFTDLRYAADDFCALTSEPEWRVHSLFCTGKVARHDLPRHPRLVSHISNPDLNDREKALFFVQEFMSEKLIRAMPLRAIVMPRVVGHGPSRLLPAAGAAAQRAIAMSTIDLSRWTGATTFVEVARLVRAIPSYFLEIGDEPQAPQIVSDLIRKMN
jgi:hypothetical protein